MYLMQKYIVNALDKEIHFRRIQSSREVNSCVQVKRNRNKQIILQKILFDIFS